MKDETTFSDNGPPPTTPAHEPSKKSDGSTPLPGVPQDGPVSTDPPLMEQRLAPPHHARLLLVALVVLIILAGGYGIFRAISPPPHQVSSTFQQAHCPFPVSGDFVEGKDVTCGFLVVPEDRSQPQGPTIRLAVAIFKTPNPHPAPDPLLLLGGGPGLPQLAMTGPYINAKNRAFFEPDRDYILLDQRGVGYSQPSLRCLDNDRRACHDRLVKLGINLNAYTTLENAADVHDLIRALGYRQVNLDGVSYGTRLALTIMRLYPADVRSVVLDSVIPQQVNMLTSIPPTALRAFDVLFHGCATNPSCNVAYPHLQAVFYQLVADLNTTPITQVSSPSGKPVSVHFTGNDLVVWLRQSLQDTSVIPLLPKAIFQIRQHDYSLLSGLYGSSNSSNDTMSWGLFYSVLCGEDAAFTTQHALQASVQGLPPQAQPALLDSVMHVFSVCQFWGMKPVPAIQKEPVRSTIPTLILQGEYDPLTTPTNGMLAAETLKKSYFFLFPGLSHAVQAHSTCPSAIMFTFLDKPTEKPDASCISSMSGPVFT